MKLDKKEANMKKLMLGIILIIIVTVVNFKKDDIFYYYEVFKLKENSHESTNDYTFDYELSYVKNTNKLELTNINDIKNAIYTLLNSGAHSVKRYCSKEYKDCVDNIREIANDSNLLSYINSFVHPYNSFNNITFDFDGDISLKITNNKIYTDKEIEEINKKVDEVIKDKIKFNMNDRERIKIIHDYIIDNTKYDTLKNINIKDTTYESNTAYGVLFQGYGICSGYADTMAIFLTKLGYINYKISNESHIWNLVLLDDKWYHIDLTWDDPVYTNIDINKIEYDYFLKTTNELRQAKDKEHTFNEIIYAEAR